MGKQGVLLIVLGIAIGASLVLGTWVVFLISSPPSALGGSVDTVGTLSMASGRLKGQGEAEGIYLFEHEAKKLVVYMMNNKTLELLAVRDCQYDFRPTAFSPRGGGQKPTVKEMKDGLR